jgi:hypothetical protein
MINKVYLFLFIGILILFNLNCLNINENFTNEIYLEDTIDYVKKYIKDYDYNKVGPVINYKYNNNQIIKRQVLAKGETIELLDLPYCKRLVNVEYTNNVNYIINNQISIYQDVVNPWDQNIKIGDELLNLYQISWRKSVFTFNKKLVGLELHLSHINSKNGKKTSIIFPLSFTESIEHFTNLETIDLLNILIESGGIIPKLISGQTNIGKKIDFNLCALTKILLEHDKFFFTETSSNELYLITPPQKFNKKIANIIRENLIEPKTEVLKN